MSIKKSFYRCSCFLTNNIFLSSLKLHVKFVSKEQFLNDYKNKLNGLSQLDVDKIFDEIETEQNRRKNLDNDSSKRIEVIKANYKPLHPHLYTFQDSYLSNEFISVYNKVKSIELLKDLEKIKELNFFGRRIYSCKVFTEQFCKEFLEEIINFEESDLPKGRPNSMNNYGILLNELGFDSFIETFRNKYLTDMFRIMYPECVDETVGLDSHKAFIVVYKENQDSSLSYHFDNAEVTLNVSLGKNFQDGELYFGPMSNENVSAHETNNFICVAHKPTIGVFHRGQQFHEASEITEGERYNLIIWMRSSKIRNQLCPMCREKPVSLIKSENTFGDGFSID